MIAQKLYEEYYNDLYRFGRSLTEDPDQAEDLVAETFLRATENSLLLDQLTERERKAWLFRVLKNYFIDIYRRRKGEIYLEDAGVFSPVIEDNTLEKTAVLDLLNHLSPSHQQVVIFRYWSGLNSREIGDLLSLAPSTVRYRLSVALKRLKQLT